MDLREALYSRRAVREFTDSPVERATLERLIDAAIQAPSAVNRQPWAFTVVRDRALLDRVASAARQFMLAQSQRESPSFVHFRHLFTDPQYDIFHRAPTLIVISCVDASPWAAEDCSLAAENLMLAACAEGLGTCWIGFAQPWLATPEGLAALQLPATYVPVAPIIIGHPKSTPPPVLRKPPLVHWL